MQRAIYKGEVYEQFVIRGVTVMRRAANSYVNVTQLLVAAGLNRNQRRNILKRRDFPTTKDVINGGSLQGTWIPGDLAAQFAAAHGVADEFRALYSVVDEQSPISGNESVDSIDSSVSDCDYEEPSQTSIEWIGTLAEASRSPFDHERFAEANRGPFDYERLVKVYEESSRLHQTAWAISHAHLGSFGYLEPGTSEMQSSEMIVIEILLNFRRGRGLSFQHDEFVEGQKVRDALVKQIHALTGKEPRIEIRDDKWVIFES